MSAQVARSAEEAWAEVVVSTALDLMTAVAATGMMVADLAWAAHAGVTAPALLLADPARLFKAEASRATKTWTTSPVEVVVS